MKIEKCRNKKCQRSLPEGYKHKYCENCRNEHAKKLKDTGKAFAGVAVLAVSILSSGKINLKK